MKPGRKSAVELGVGHLVKWELEDGCQICFWTENWEWSYLVNQSRIESMRARNAGTVKEVICNPASQTLGSFTLSI